MEEVEFPVGTPIYDQLKLDFLERRYEESRALSEDPMDTDELEILIKPPPPRRIVTRRGKRIR